MNATVLTRTEQSLEREAEGYIQEDFLSRQTYWDVFDAKRVCHSEDLDPGDMDLRPNRVGQNIYGIAELAKSLEDLPNGNGSTAVLVEGLRCDEKHATMIGGSRNTLALR